MAQTKKTKAGEKDFSASSTPSRKYLIAAYIGGLALAGYAVRLAWVYMTYHVLPLQGIILFIIAACFLLNVVTAKCTYTLGEEGLTLQKKSLFQNRTIYVAYKDIFGVHHFKNQLMKPATYRYTRHMYSQLDNREIWSLLYDIGEVEKIGRIMMTGSAAFWHEFSLRLPDRVAIPQEEVIAYVYQGMREKLIASGKVPPELLQKLKEAEAADAEDDMTFEEGIEQLRQEGTDMGGSDYEVTLEDIKEKVELQVTQNSYKVNESTKKLALAEKNMEKAEENLRYANLGFKEGVIPTSNVLEAQTAWFSAQAGKIDAQIDVKMSELYLNKSMGILK